MANKGGGDGLPKLDRKSVKEILDRYRITSGKGFRLKDHDPEDIATKLLSKDEGPAYLARGVEQLSDLQNLLYANSTWSLLIVFQAMDAAGKDGTIKHVLSGVNPQGVTVTSFKQPGPEDLAHDFLWRINRALPAAGTIGIFNRSHYEEVLVTRVHPQLLTKQHLPPSLIGGKKFWENRLSDISAFEEHLARQGTIVLKFFLNVSKAEQKRRFLERLDDPVKNWKFSSADIAERSNWDAYADAYEEAIAATAAEHAPWFVVPADRKWFARLVVVAAINEALLKLDLRPVEVPPDEQVRLKEARQLLEAED
jgi:PPK2 family polyphosphate:nucleotide phosphotransferase